MSNRVVRIFGSNFLLLLVSLDSIILVVCRTESFKEVTTEDLNSVTILSKSAVFGTNITSFRADAKVLCVAFKSTDTGVRGSVEKLFAMASPYCIKSGRSTVITNKEHLSTPKMEEHRGTLACGGSIRRERIRRGPTSRGTKASKNGITIIHISDVFLAATLLMMMRLAMHAACDKTKSMMVLYSWTRAPPRQKKEKGRKATKVTGVSCKYILANVVGKHYWCSPPPLHQSQPTCDWYRLCSWLVILCAGFGIHYGVGSRDH